MYKCIKAVTPVLTFDKSYQVGQEISETEFENLEVRLRGNFESIEPEVEQIQEVVDTKVSLEGEQTNTTKQNFLQFIKFWGQNGENK